ISSHAALGFDFSPTPRGTQKGTAHPLLLDTSAPTGLSVFPCPQAQAPLKTIGGIRWHSPFRKQAGRACFYPTTRSSCGDQVFPKRHLPPRLPGSLLCGESTRTSRV